MRKLFLFIPALALTLLANAAVINITPGGSIDLRHAIRDYAAAGDTVVLADGEYTQGSDYTLLNKDIVVMAAENAAPVVKFTVPAQLLNGARVEFKGIKFDMENLHNQSWYEHLISVEDYELTIVENKEKKVGKKVDGNILIFDGCEFYNDTLNNSVIFCSSERKIDSVIVNNCKFHDIKKSCIFLENTDTKGLIVKNSTFYNISTADKYYAGVIDTRATSGEFLVDHCTFYNVEAMNTDYAAIGKVGLASGAVVSNCIFALADLGASSNRTIRDKVTANNCLVYNYTTDSRYGMQSNVTKNNCIRDINPLFVDAANNDFTLHNASPARKVNAGAAIGDPRWAKAIQPIAIPATLVPVDATMSDNASVLLGTPDSIFLKSRDNLEWAKWKVSVAKDGLYNFTAYAKRTGSTESQRLEIMVLNPAENDTLKFNSSNSVANEGSISTGEVNLVAENTYVIKVRNTYSWADSKLLRVAAEYLGGAITAIPDTLWPVDAKRSERAFVNDNGELRFTDDDHTGLIHDQWAKWKVSVAEAAKYKFTAGVNSDNGQNYRITLKNEDETSTLGTWYGIGNSSGERKIATEMVDLAIGNYVLMIEDTVKWSHGRVVNIVASYEGGNTVEVPGQILAEEAVIGIVENGHQKMSHLMGSGDLKYDDNGYNMEEFATWTLNVTKAGEMTVTLNVSEAGHKFSLELYQGNTRLDSIGEIIDGDNKTIWDDGNITLPDHLIFPEKGTYTLKLWNNQKHSGGALHGITFERAPIVVDENATENGNWAYCASDETIDLSIIRTFKGGMYNTICLPIELGSTNSMNAAFGAGYELLKLEEATLNGDELILNFESVQTLEAGIPHLIKPVDDVVNPSFTGRKIKTTVAYTVTKGVVDFIGNFVVSEVPAGENNLFLGPNDLLYFSQSATPIKGMRAYFQVNGVSNPSQAIKRARIVMNGQVATGIDLVNGELVDGTVKTIENGQLIIIRDGVRYNVMGAKLQ